MAVPLVQSQIEEARRYLAEELAMQFGEEIYQRMEMRAGDIHSGPLEFDSPLEAAFWVWWMAFGKVDFYAKSLRLAPHVEVEACGRRYVLDFAIRPYRSLVQPSERQAYIDARWPLVGIELDGHAFHEKTKEQVTHRNQRDRDLQKEGWRIFHFSFSEFTAHPSGALIEVIDFVRACESRISDQFYTEQWAIKGQEPLPDYIQAGITKGTQA